MRQRKRKRRRARPVYTLTGVFRPGSGGRSNVREADSSPNLVMSERCLLAPPDGDVSTIVGEFVAFLDTNHPACVVVSLGAVSVCAANAFFNWRSAGA